MKISVITVTQNCVATIRDCLGSVEGQSWVDREHVVVDGASRDGTLEILQEHRAQLACLVSEPDKGMYDGLNKALALCSGEVMGLLHADDLYYDEQVLARVAGVFQDPAVEACYGDLLYVRAEKPDTVVRYWRSGGYAPNKFYWGWMPPHPTFFVRRNVYERHGGFNLAMGTAADYELMLRFCLKNCINTVYIPNILVRMRVGGMSNASFGNRLRANLSDRQAWQVNGLTPYPWTLWCKPLRKLPQWLWAKRFQTASLKN